jgi:hypothetical protein
MALLIASGDNCWRMTPPVVTLGITFAVICVLTKISMRNRILFQLLNSAVILLSMVFICDLTKTSMRTRILFKLPDLAIIVLWCGSMILHHCGGVRWSMSLGSSFLAERQPGPSFLLVLSPAGFLFDVSVPKIF